MAGLTSATGVLRDLRKVSELRGRRRASRRICLSFVLWERKTFIR